MDTSKYKISLVQPNDIIGDNLILPYAIGVLWESINGQPTVRDRWCLDQVIYSKVPVDEIARSISSCHVVAFSCYLWNIDYNLQLAREIKKLNPDVYVIFGGPQITTRDTGFWPEAQEFVDIAICGEGEQAFTGILSTWPDVVVNEIPGAWTPEFFGEEAPRRRDFSNYVSPYLSGFYTNIIQQAREHNLTLQATLQTNRGCPYHCTFCEEGVEYKNKIHVLPQDIVHREIEWFGEQKIEYVSVADDNWGIFDRDIEITRWVCDTKIKHGYPKNFSATFAKNAPERVLEIARIDHDMGTDLIRGVTVSMQSLLPSTLKGIKRFNLVPAKQHDLAAELSRLDIGTYVELIWPLPHETLDSFLHGLDLAMDMKFDTFIAVYPLGITPGAELSEDYRGHYKLGGGELVQLDLDDNRHQFYINTRRQRQVISTTWATESDVLQGHVIYTWMVPLIFFGFATPAIEHCRQTLSMSPSKFVREFLSFLETCSTNDAIVAYHHQMKSYWQGWLHQRSVPDIDIFPEHNTDFWYPYARLSGFLQQHHHQFITCLNEFLLQLGIDQPGVSAIIERCQHSTVIHQQKYPYKTPQVSVSINHRQPEFDSLYEFARYYYLWSRKKAHAKTSFESSNIDT